ncbi:MAG: hypothetical protein H0T47_16735 [Planctomycetaceae bacterium]|nr:hypothetical protein [Planctomycetaceae bacterium]
MPVFSLTRDELYALEETTFAKAGLSERSDLQRLLRDQISAVAPGTLIISEEFGHWDGSSRRIDLLGIDKAANIVIVELKRTEDGGHMELQALRYAAMVSTMTFEQAVETFSRYTARAVTLASRDKQFSTIWAGMSRMRTCLHKM